MQIKKILVSLSIIGIMLPACSFAQEEMDGGELPGAEVVACSDTTKVYNPATQQCEPRESEATKRCQNGIQLNTSLPFIGDCLQLTDTGPTSQDENGITTTTTRDAFPTLIGAMMRILTSAMLIIGLLLIIVGGIMMTMEGANSGSFSKGKSLILKVGAVLALLGLSGVILKLINPTFFT
ncbi:MAG: hypothetical protein LBP53_00835 [Candidatus Peribacteria bacterium]|jgi:hypothetical protein|nr:hypothetical protein [Candidatus Peribacteria bacterium]